MIGGVVIYWCLRARINPKLRKDMYVEIVDFEIEQCSEGSAEGALVGEQGTV